MIIQNGLFVKHLSNVVEKSDILYLKRNLRERKYRNDLEFRYRSSILLIQGIKQVALCVVKRHGNLLIFMTESEIDRKFDRVGNQK